MAAESLRDTHCDRGRARTSLCTVAVLYYHHRQGPQNTRLITCQQCCLSRQGHSGHVSSSICRRRRAQKPCCVCLDLGWLTMLYLGQGPLGRYHAHGSAHGWIRFCSPGEITRASSCLAQTAEPKVGKWWTERKSLYRFHFHIFRQKRKRKPDNWERKR